MFMKFENCEKKEHRVCRFVRGSVTDENTSHAWNLERRLNDVSSQIDLNRN